MYVCVAENAELLGFFYFFLHLPHRQFSFIDLCLSSKMYWTFNCSWDNVMKWNVFFFCVLHIFQNFPCTLGEKSKSVSFSRVYVCVKAKLTLVSFFLLFYFVHLPLTNLVRNLLYVKQLACTWPGWLVCPCDMCLPGQWLSHQVPLVFVINWKNAGEKSGAKQHEPGQRDLYLTGH